MPDRAPVEPVLTVGDATSATGATPAGLAERLLEEVLGLRADFDAKIRYDEVKERHIASMHEELQTHRGGLHLRILRPVLMDLVAMYDDLEAAIRGGAATVGEAALPSFLDTLTDILVRNDVASYHTDGDELDAKRQRVIRVVSTDKPELHGRVAERLRPGFTWEERILRPEWVATYRQTPAGETMTNDSGGQRGGR